MEHNLTGYKVSRCRCSVCTEANRVWTREYRNKNRFKVNAWNKSRAAKGRKYLDTAKDVPCADCGIRYPSYVMDFDHLRDKDFNVSRRTAGSLKTLQTEIDKCEVVCANCHRIRTHDRSVI